MTNRKHLVTYSEVETFRTCPRKHHYRYRERLRPNYTSSRVRIGSAYHRGVEAGILAAFARMAQEHLDEHQAALVAIGAGVEAATAQVRADYEALDPDATDDARARAEADLEEANAVLPWMVGHYFRVTVTDFARLVPLGVERVFEVPIDHRGHRGGPLSHAGIFDLVYFDREFGDLVLHDHKTVDVAPWNVERRVELDPQMAGYVAALRALQRRGKLAPLHPMTAAPDAILKAPSGRVVYSVMRRARPEEPRVNQDGTVSVAACDTTAEAYERALAAQSEPEWLLKARAAVEGPLSAGWARRETAEARWAEVRRKQQEQLDRLRGQGDRYFARCEYHRGDDEIEVWRREMYVEATRIRAADRDPAERTRSPGACTMPWSPPCEYRAICLHDAPEIRAQYRVAEAAHEEIEQRKAGG